MMGADREGSRHPSVELSVVFPAFNEAENLRRFPVEVLPVLESLNRSYEVVVVDDGSADDTNVVASGLGPRVRVVRHQRNRGLGAALRTGFGSSRGELVVTADADLTFSPSLIPQLLERFERGDVDVVSGSPRLAGYAKEIPSYRIVVGRLSTVIYSLLLGSRVTAVSPIFRLYRRTDVLSLDLRATGFDINAEILFGLLSKGKKVAEIPAPLTQRIHGTSNLNYPREMRRHLRLVGRMIKWKLGWRDDPATTDSAATASVHDEPVATAPPSDVAQAPRSGVSSLSRS